MIAEVGRAADANFACPLGAMEVALKAVAPLIAARALIRSRGETFLGTEVDELVTEDVM